MNGQLREVLHHPSAADRQQLQSRLLGPRREACGEHSRHSSHFLQGLTCSPRFSNASWASKKRQTSAQKLITSLTRPRPESSNGASFSGHTVRANKDSLAPNPYAAGHDG